MSIVIVRAKDVNRTNGYKSPKRSKQPPAPPSNLPKIRDIVQDTDATKRPFKARSKT